MLRVYDKYGHEKTLAWLYQEFGNVEIQAPDPQADPYFEIVELHENDDIQPGHEPHAPACIITRVLDENGAPLPGVTAVFWWPDAPHLPGSGWHEHGVTGQTKPEGTVDFPMGGGAYYDPRTDEVKLVPLCAWNMHKAQTLKEVSASDAEAAAAT